MAIIEIFGEISFAYLKEIISAIENLKNETNISFLINSEGGSIDGIDFFGNFLKAKKQQGYVFQAFCVNALSAAYWIASYCDKIFAIDKNATFGNIGVVTSIGKSGDSDLIIASSEEKEQLFTGEKPSNEVLSNLKTINDAIYRNFVETVKNNRNIRDDKCLTGLIYGAEEALSYGLIDGVRTMDEEKENSDLKVLNEEKDAKIKELEIEINGLKEQIKQFEVNYKQELENIKDIMEIKKNNPEITDDEAYGAISEHVPAGEFAINYLKNRCKSNVSNSDSEFSRFLRG